MIRLLLILLIPLVLSCKYEFECKGCTTCYDSECVYFDEGELCIPANHVEIREDLEMYYEFYYSRAITIEQYLCNTFGISINFLIGMPINSTLNKTYFEENYKELSTKDCENWAFAPYRIK